MPSFTLVVIGKQRVMHICQGVLSDFSHNDLFVLLVPFEYRPRSDPEFPANLGRDGNLALRGQSGMCKRH
jgi:hypothetical protein